jgi:hypothetical protein
LTVDVVKWSLLKNGGTSLELVLATDQEVPVTSPDRGFVIRIWSSNTIQTVVIAHGEALATKGIIYRCYRKLVRDMYNCN